MAVENKAANIVSSVGSAKQDSDSGTLDSSIVSMSSLRLSTVHWRDFTSTIGAGRVNNPQLKSVQALVDLHDLPLTVLGHFPLYVLLCLNTRPLHPRMDVVQKCGHLGLKFLDPSKR